MEACRSTVATKVRQEDVVGGERHPTPNQAEHRSDRSRATFILVNRTVSRRSQGDIMELE